MAKRVAVAGATGNLGRRIVKALLGQGAEVVAIAREGSDREKVKVCKAVIARPSAISWPLFRVFLF